MTSLIDKIEQLIKREKTTPDKKVKDEKIKSSSEILSELFSAFNADPPKIEDIPVKKSKKSKRKHKKEKKKRSRSSSSSSNSDGSEYSHKHKKRKKSKSKKRRDRSRSRSKSPKIKKDPDTKVIRECEKSDIKLSKIKNEDNVKIEVKEELKRKVSVKVEDSQDLNVTIKTVDACQIPMPDSPKETKIEDDLRNKLDKKGDSGADNDKGKSKIQIKNLKFSAVFEETVKKAEEEARKKAEKYEEGEYTDSSSSSVKEVITNTPFPKTSDPGGILKKAAEENKILEDDKTRSRKTKHKEKSSKRDSSKSKKRSSSRTRRSRSTSRRRHHRSSSKSHRRSQSKTRRRSRSRSRHRSRHSPRHRGGRRSSRSPSRIKLADSEKKRLLEVARRNAINMLKNGAVPAGAAALPPHTRNQVMAAIQSGGKSVDELTDFCKHLSKKEALGELSSVSSNEDGDEENEDTLAFHHPFLVKEKAPIVMNIRGGAPLPIKSSVLPIANKEELRLQFPVSSGTQHRDKAIEWVPVSPKKDSMQIAKLNSTSKPVTKPTSDSNKSELLALPAPPTSSSQPPYLKNFSMGSQLSSVPLALPAPGPQAYPPGVDAIAETSKPIDVAAIVSQKIALIRREQEENEITKGLGWSSKDRSLGQFTGSTGANILTPRELASGTQAWAKKDQLVRAAPVEGGMGMTLLQKMGWTPGQGLGKEGTGTLQPLLLEVKLDTKGLQAKEETNQRNNKGVKTFRKNTRGAGGPLIAGGKHPVSLLGEYCSKHKLGPPEYSLCFECGPDHKKNFLFKVRVAGTEYQPTVASQNKKQAKADAAQLALQKLGILPN